jgi:hypothetical protein
VAYPTWRSGQAVQYRITVREERRSLDSRPDLNSDLVLERILHLRVEAHETSQDAGSLRMQIRRLIVRGEFDGKPLAYDSDLRNRSEKNPLADLLSTVIGRRFDVKTGPGGEFLGVHGLDSAWRGAGPSTAGLPPAPLLGIQFLFRDHAMLGLLRDTLAPPAITRPSGAGEGSTGPSTDARARLHLSIPAAVPLVTPLAWDATFELIGPGTIAGDPCLRIAASGPVKAVRPAGDAGGHGLRCEVFEGKRRGELCVHPETSQVIRQEMNQNLVMSLILDPPAGGETLRMRIEQKTHVRVERATGDEK